MLCNKLPCTKQMLKYIIVIKTANRNLSLHAFSFKTTKVLEVGITVCLLITVNNGCVFCNQGNAKMHTALE